MTAVALRTQPRHLTTTQRRGHHAVAVPAPVRVERLLYMCAAAGEREARGERAAAFHGFCRGGATNPARALGALPDPDGRLQAGRHVCTCRCHGARGEERSTGGR